MKTERPAATGAISLGAYALGDLAGEERAGLEAHLEGCPECRAEAESLGAVAQLLPLADPDRFSQPGTAAVAGARRADRGDDRRRSASSAAAPAPALGLRLRRRRRHRGSRRGAGDLRPARRRRRRARAARRVRLAAGRGQDRRHARTARLRHRDPHVRQGRPLGHPLPRLPARPARRHGSRPAPSATAGATTPTPCSARPRPLPHRGDRRPRRQPEPSSPRSSDRGDCRPQPKTGGRDVSRTTYAFALLAIAAALAIAGCGSSATAAQRRRLRRRQQKRRRLEQRPATAAQVAAAAPEAASPVADRRQRPQGRHGAGRLRRASPSTTSTKTRARPRPATAPATSAWPPVTSEGAPQAGEGAIVLEARHDQAQRRDHPGHLRRPPALHLRRGQEARRSQRQRRLGVRRPVVRAESNGEEAGD